MLPWKREQSSIFKILVSIPSIKILTSATSSVHLRWQFKTPLHSHWLGHFSIPVLQNGTYVKFIFKEKKSLDTYRWQFRAGARRVLTAGYDVSVGRQHSQRLPVNGAHNLDGGRGLRAGAEHDGRSRVYGRRIYVRMRFEGVLQVANVVDHVLDHLELGETTIFRHKRHQLFQLRQVGLDFFVLDVALVFADFGWGVVDARIRGRTVTGDGLHVEYRAYDFLGKLAKSNKIAARTISHSIIIFLRNYFANVNIAKYYYFTSEKKISNTQLQTKRQKNNATVKINLCN